MNGTDKAHLWNALPKATLPASTWTIHFSPMSSGSHLRMRLLTSVMIFVKRCCICSGELFGDHPRARDEGVGKGRVMDEQAFGHEVLRPRHGEVVDPFRGGLANVLDLDEGEIVA